MKRFRTGVRLPSPPPRRSKRHIACSDLFYQSERAHSAAPPLQIATAYAGSRFGFGCKPGSCGIYTVAIFQKERHDICRVFLFGFCCQRRLHPTVIELLRADELPLRQEFTAEKAPVRRKIARPLLSGAGQFLYPIQHSAPPHRMGYRAVSARSCRALVPHKSR